MQNNLIFTGLADVGRQGIQSMPNFSIPIVITTGHVLEICLDSNSPLYNSPKDIGVIRFREALNNGGAKLDKDINTIAFPLDRSIARYPFPGELVVILLADGETAVGSNRTINKIAYYINVVSALHNVTYNAHPFLTFNKDLVSNDPVTISEGRFERLIEDINLVKTFEDKIKIYKQLQPFEGDFILQGRYGNSIRFGATSAIAKTPWSDGTAGVSGDPITTIRVNRETTDKEKDMFVVEDINSDDTSIYLTTSQPVKLNLASSQLLEPWSRIVFNGTSVDVSGSVDDSVNVNLQLKSQQVGKQNNYKGSQLLLNSDRVILNAREDFLMLFGNNGIVMSSPNEIKIDSDTSVTLYGVSGVHLGCPTKVVVDNRNTKVPSAGNYAQATTDSIYEPIILGQKLYDLLDDMIDILTTSEIVTPTGKGSFSQESLYKLKSIKARLPEMKSRAVFVDGISHNSVLEAPAPPTAEDLSEEQEFLSSGLTTIGGGSGENFNQEFDAFASGSVEGLVYVVQTDAVDNSGQGFSQGVDAINTDRVLIVINGKAVLKRVALPYIAMYQAAQKDKVKLQISSGFRPAFGKNTTAKTSDGKSISLTSQYTLRSDKSRWRKIGNFATWTDERFILEAPSSAFNPATALPKSSKHGDGIALDLNTGGRNNFQPLNTSVYVWLSKNAHKFGFVRTVGSEEWHWEYRPSSAVNGPYSVVKNIPGGKWYPDLGLDKLTV